MLIPRRTVRTSQPQNPVGIDWSNPITRGLVAAILPGNPRNMVDGVPVSVMSATGHGYGKAGRYYSAADGAQAGVMFTSPKLTSAMTNMTMLSVIELTGVPGSLRRQFMTIGDAWNSPYQECRVEFSNDPQLTVNNGLVFGQYPVPLNVPQTIGAVFRGAGGAATFINGKADGSTGDTSPTINTQGRAGWLNYAYNLSADRSPPVKGYLALYWDRDLSPEELKSVTANPYQIFEDEEEYRFVPDASGGGGALALDAASGSFALTGVAATLAKHGLLSASAGSYAISGQASTLAAHRKLNAASGSYILTGASAGLTKHGLLSASAGSYAISGQASTLAAHRKLNAASGSYILTGASAGLTKHLLVNAAPGSVTISAIDATLVYTPSSPTPVLNAEAGTIGLSGLAASLSAHRVINAGNGSVSLSGASAELLYTALAGAGSFTGQTADTVVSGGATSKPTATFSTILSDSIFTGGAGIAGSSNYHAQLEDSIFVGSASVKPICTFSQTSEALVLNGGFSVDNSTVSNFSITLEDAECSFNAQSHPIAYFNIQLDNALFNLGSLYNKSPICLKYVLPEQQTLKLIVNQCGQR